MENQILAARLQPLQSSRLNRINLRRLTLYDSKSYGSKNLNATYRTATGAGFEARF